MDLVWQTLANAVMASSFYVIIAVGFTLVFGVMRVANYAHVQFYMLGAYTVWLFYAQAHWPFFVAVGMAILIVGLLGILAERTVFRPVRGDMFAGALVGLGLLFIIEILVGRAWGVGLPEVIPVPFHGALNIWGVFIPWQRIIILPFAILMLILLYFFLRRTQLGRGVRASALDEEAAALHGVSANTMAVVALGMGSAMAGLAGALMAPIVAVYPYMGHKVLLILFVIVIVGGAGSLKGAILASILFGSLNTIITTWLDSTIAIIIACVFMGILLAVRPQGLVGYAEK